MISMSHKILCICFAAPPSGTAPQLPDGTDGQGRGAAVPPSGADTSASRSCAHAGGGGGGGGQKGTFKKFYGLRTFVLTPAINQRISMCRVCSADGKAHSGTHQSAHGPAHGQAHEEVNSQAKQKAQQKA